MKTTKQSMMKTQNMRPPKKFKTIKAAWLYLAELWDKPNIDNDGYAHVFPVPGEIRTSCLCGSVNRLRACGGHITITQHAKMKEQIAAASPYLWAMFYWPQTKAGAKERAAFCRAQAKLCYPHERLR